MMWYMPGMNWWMVVSGVFALIFFVAMGALAVWGVRQVTWRSTAEKGRALDIAQERYARGDIAKEEFDILRKDLGSS